MTCTPVFSSQDDGDWTAVLRSLVEAYNTIQQARLNAVQYARYQRNAYAVIAVLCIGMIIFICTIPSTSRKHSCWKKFKCR
jgi:hypothetical protein